MWPFLSNSMWLAVATAGVCGGALAIYLRSREVRSKLLINPKDERMHRILRRCGGSAVLETYR